MFRRIFWSLSVFSGVFIAPHAQELQPLCLGFPGVAFLYIIWEMIFSSLPSTKSKVTCFLQAHFLILPQPNTFQYQPRSYVMYASTHTRTPRAQTVDTIDTFVWLYASDPCSRCKESTQGAQTGAPKRNLTLALPPAHVEETSLFLGAAGSGSVSRTSCETMTSEAADLRTFWCQ